MATIGTVAAVVAIPTGFAIAQDSGEDEGGWSSAEEIVVEQQAKKKAEENGEDSATTVDLLNDCAAIEQEEGFTPSQCEYAREEFARDCQAYEQLEGTIPGPCELPIRGEMK